MSASASASQSSSASASPSASVTPGRESVFLQFANQYICAIVQGTPADGTPVTMESCNPALSEQRFDILDNGLIRFSGTNYCLDAGSSPANGIALKLWTCYPGLSQQTFSHPNSRGLYRTANSE
jgi:hypothetical protein